MYIYLGTDVPPVEYVTRIMKSYHRAYLSECERFERERVVHHQTLGQLTDRYEKAMNDIRSRVDLSDEVWEKFIDICNTEAWGKDE